MTWASLLLGAEESKEKSYVISEKGRETDTTSPPGESPAFQDPSPGRVIASPTGFIQEKKSFNLGITTTFAPVYYFPLFFFNLTYGVTKNFEIRSNFYLPVTHVGVGVYPKFSIKLSKYVRYGLMLDIAYYQSYTECRINGEDLFLCRPQFMIGLTPLIFTAGTRSFLFNFVINTMYNKSHDNICFYTAENLSEECGDSLHDYLVHISSMGLSLRVAKKVKLSLEFQYIFMHDFSNINVVDYTYDTTSHRLIPMIGIKIFGKRFYGDFNLYIVATYGKEYHGPWGWGIMPFPTPATTFGFTVP